MKDILTLAKEYKIKAIPYGLDIAKIEPEETKQKHGKLILVTAMTSNASGIGKTTVSIGLADALNQLNYKTMLALREPSLGPVFGIKGGATGGGKSMVVPSDEINLHFTGDFHAITAANNLLSAIIDNHIFQGNALDINPNKIFFKRCLDVNDRSLRNISYSIGKTKVTTGFNITAASEVMAICALSKNLNDLKTNLGNILVALNNNNQPVFAKDLHAQDCMAILLKDAIKPNLVQTKYGTPALVHLGPFANIAHGCNSIIATEYALTHSNYCVTEAGFGSDLGAEKFLDIKCRKLNRVPDAVVLVVTLEVIKQHGNGNLIAGFENVKRHIQNLTKVYNLPTVVAINFHNKDSLKDINIIKTLCFGCGVEAIITKAWTHGAVGCLNLAKRVVDLCKENKTFNFCYNVEDSIKDKIYKIATNVYDAKNVEYSTLAEEKLNIVKNLNFENFFVSIAKTQFSFSDDKTKLGAPKDFILKITDIEIRSGAGIIVATAGNMLLMPGLGKESNYLKLKMENNKILNLT